MADRIKVTGKVKWAHRLFNPETFNDKTTWNVEFYPDDIDIFYALQRQGMKNVIKKDDDGFHLKLSRPVEKPTRKGVLKFDPPKIKGPDPDEPPTSIGNDSKVEVDLSVYEHTIPGSTKKAKAIRLEGVTVTELVEYNNNKTEETVDNSYY